MKTLDAALIEEEVITVVKEICDALKINAVVDSEFRPGNYIKSQVLLDSIATIEDKLGIIIPNEYYVFSDKNMQLSVKETAQKIIKAANNGK